MKRPWNVIKRLSDKIIEDDRNDMETCPVEPEELTPSAVEISGLTPQLINFINKVDKIVRRKLIALKLFGWIVLNKADRNILRMKLFDIRNDVKNVKNNIIYYLNDENVYRFMWDNSWDFCQYRSGDNIDVKLIRKRSNLTHNVKQYLVKMKKKLNEID